MSVIQQSDNSKLDLKLADNRMDKSIVHRGYHTFGKHQRRITRAANENRINWMR